MAWNSSPLTYTLKATASLKAAQYYAVKPSTTAGECKVCAAVLDTAIGIVQNAPAANEAAVIAYSGVSKAVAGTSVGWVIGVSVGFNTTGRIVPRTTSVFTKPTPSVIGQYIKMESSVANGDIISIVVNPLATPTN